MTILQVEATGLFSEIAQLGIVFTLLVAIIVVLGRRIMKLEKKIEEMTEERFEQIKDNAIIIKDATSAMRDMAHTRCNYAKEV